MHDLLRMVAPVVALLPLVLVVTRRRFVRAFEQARAFVPDRAIPPPAGPLSGWWQARLAAASVLSEARDGRLWLDRRAWQAYRDTRRRRALRVLAVLLVVVGILAYAVGR